MESSIQLSSKITIFWSNKLCKHALTSAEDNDASLSGCSLHGAIIDLPDVVHDVNDEARVLVAVEEEHVPKGSIGQCRAEDGDAVALGPVADGALVADLLSQPRHHLKMQQQTDDYGLV